MKVNIFRKIFLRLLLSIIFFSIICFSILLLIRFYAQKSLIKSTRINSVNGIDKIESVNLNGFEQNILIRSENINNPVLLFLHGGISTVAMPLSRNYENELVKHFTLVHWDRKGAGKSYRAGITEASMSIDSQVKDAVKLTEYLIKRFNTGKIYLLGLSFGSTIGLKAVHDNPDYYFAYIGVGQIVNAKRAEEISYDFTFEKALTESNRNAVKALEEIGKPPYDSYQELLEQRKWLKKMGGDSRKFKNYRFLKWKAFCSPDYSLWEVWKTFKGLKYERELFWDQYRNIDLFKTVKSIDVPVYFMGGRFDYKVPSVLAEEYLRFLICPQKEFIWFESSGHALNYEEPELFQSVIIGKVLKETKITR
ncbi:alpha/beta fold hydrolase [candidate division KSB1 bacterium]